MTAARQPGPALTWGLRGRSPSDVPVEADGPPDPPAEGLLGGTGRGVRVCVVDSGVERDHPMVGPLDRSWRVFKDADGVHVEETEEGTPAATAPPAPGSSAASRPTASCPASGSSATGSPAAATSSSKGSGGP